MQTKIKRGIFSLLMFCVFGTYGQIADTSIHMILKYDTSALRIAGNKVSIGIITTSANGETTETKGLLKGKYPWRKFRFAVVGGSITNGKLKITGDNKYKKGDSITVSAYTRKWLLGGKGKFLFTKKIPYDYETGIKVLTKGTFSKAPGNHVQFGIRTIYDNRKTIDKWSPVSENLQDFVLKPEGSHISKHKGDLKIENDPVKITNDKVRLIAELAKYPAIKDTLQIILDYVAAYKCQISSNRNGHNLFVTVNVYNDSIIRAKLMKIVVGDSVTDKTYDYLINTSGGSLLISTRGANGSDGASGFNGMSGSDGAAGTTTTETATVNNADGTTTTTTNTVTGPGGNGTDGSPGGNGSPGGDGYDGGNIVIYYNEAAEPYMYLINTISIPGAGGIGGAGGQGGRGGSGGNGNPSGSSGSNGSDGSRGVDGSPGRKGKIIGRLISQ